MLKPKLEYLAYPQLVILASPHFLPHIMEYIISADGIHIVRKKRQQVIIGWLRIHFSYIILRK